MTFNNINSTNYDYFIGRPFKLNGYNNEDYELLIMKNTITIKQNISIDNKSERFITHIEIDKIGYCFSVNSNIPVVLIYYSHNINTIGKPKYFRFYLDVS